MGREHNHNRFAPVEHIPHGRELTNAIEAFGHQRKLVCDTYYHNLPIWIVRQAEPIHERIRRMQITAYLVSKEAFLSVVSSVNIVAGAGLLVPKQVPSTRFELKRILTKQKLDQAKFCFVLDQAWSATVDFTYQPNELITVPHSRVGSELQRS